MNCRSISTGGARDRLGDDAAPGLHPLVRGVARGASRWRAAGFGLAALVFGSVIAAAKVDLLLIFEAPGKQWLLAHVPTVDRRVRRRPAARRPRPISTTNAPSLSAGARFPPVEGRAPPRGTFGAGGESVCPDRPTGVRGIVVAATAADAGVVVTGAGTVVAAGPTVVGVVGGEAACTRGA